MHRLPAWILAGMIATLAAGCGGNQSSSQSTEAPADSSQTNDYPAGPAARLIDDPAEQHNARMVAFSEILFHAARNYAVAHADTLPGNIPQMVDEGFLWALPDIDRPYRYEYIENIGDASNPLWNQISFVFTGDKVVFGYFPLNPGHPLENEVATDPMQSRIIDFELTPNEVTFRDGVEREGSIEKFFMNNDVPDEWQLSAFRLADTTPATRVAFSIYDTLELLPEHFVKTEGRLPANFAEMIQGEFQVTPQFRALTQEPPEGTDLAAVIDLFLDPSDKIFRETAFPAG